MYRLISDLRKVPVLRVLFPFVVGLVLTNMFPVVLSLRQTGLFALYLLLMLLILRIAVSQESPHYNASFGSTLFLFFILMGGISSRIPSRVVQMDFDQEELVVIGTVRDALLEKEKSLSVNIECMHCIVGDSVYDFRQNLVVYIGKDSVIPSMIPGDVWVFAGTIRAIKNRGNPGEFDYQSYMQRKNFSYTMFVKNVNFAHVLTQNPTELRYFPSRIRKRIMDSWDQSDKDIAILSALTLGNKTLLDRDTKRSYATAGAMHLLAVSGLHVGMIWWILDILIRVPANSRFWRTIKLLIILSILWIYAGITGFSDSVTRSVSMFSLVAFSKTINRNSNIFNTLFLSAFILLLLKPSRIMEPGFQLSYIAVFGIITIQPMLSKTYQNKNKMVKWILDLLSVSISAQLATLPLVLLFFSPVSCLVSAY